MYVYCTVAAISSLKILLLTPNGCIYIFTHWSSIYDNGCNISSWINDSVWHRTPTINDSFDTQISFYLQLHIQKISILWMQSAPNVTCIFESTFSNILCAFNIFDCCTNILLCILIEISKYSIYPRMCSFVGNTNTIRRCNCICEHKHQHFKLQFCTSVCQPIEFWRFSSRSRFTCTCYPIHC